MLEFEIVARGLFRADQLDIDYDPSRRMPTTPELCEWMGTLWEEKLIQARQRQVPLYDAPLFRFVDAQSNGQQFKLTLGDTSYKEYVTTREPAFGTGQCALGLLGRRD
jgi:hypothetical protein